MFILSAIIEEESELIITDLKPAPGIRGSNIKVEKTSKVPKAKVPKVKKVLKKIKQVEETTTSAGPRPAKQRGRKAGKGKLDAGLLTKKVVRYSAPPRALESTSTTPVSTSSHLDSSPLTGQDGGTSAANSSLFQYGLPPLPDPILSFVDSLPPLPELASMLPDLPEVDLLALAGLLPPPSIDDVLNALEMAIPAPDPMTPEEEELLVTQILERQILISKNNHSPADASSSSSSSRGESSSSKRTSLDQVVGNSVPIVKKLKLTHNDSGSVESIGGGTHPTPPTYDLLPVSNGDLTSTNGVGHSNSEAGPDEVLTSLSNGNRSGDIQQGAVKGLMEVQSEEEQFDFALDPALMLEGPKSRNVVVQVE